MAKDWAIAFYKSKAWIDCRNGYMQSQYYICEICKGTATICHHKEWLTPKNILDPMVALNWDKLQAVCIDCHNRIHQSTSATVEGLTFDDKGNLIKVSPTKQK